MCCIILSLPRNVSDICRLLEHKTQERYYAKIVERYMSFCSRAGECDELLRRLASLDINEAFTRPAVSVLTPTSVARDTDLTNPSLSSENQHALAEILFALRKLREGIVASDRTDEFTAQAYLFCIRLAILARHAPTYYPAILHALRRFGSANLLSTVERSEICAYLVLDAACRRGSLAEAYALRGRYGPKDDPKVNAVLTALAHDNYVAFRKVKNSMDGYKARLMDGAHEDLRTVALKCFGKAYHSVNLPFLEFCTGETWAGLKEIGVGWDLQGDKVIIRKVSRPR